METWDLIAASYLRRNKIIFETCVGSLLAVGLFEFSYERRSPDNKCFFFSKITDEFVVIIKIEMGWYLTHAHSHITQAVSAMESCSKPHQPGIVVGQR